MILDPIIDIDKIYDLSNELFDRLKSGLTPIERNVMYYGSSEPESVYWNQEHKFWIGESGVCYGTEDPAHSNSLPVICWIKTSPENEEINRSSVSLFLRDSSSGRIYLGHKGKLGGPVPGQTMKRFFEFFQGTTATVRWPDGKLTEVALISALDDNQLSANIAAFIHFVAKYKEIQQVSRQSI